MQAFLQKNSVSILLLLILVLGALYYLKLGQEKEEIPAKAHDPKAAKITMFSKQTCIYCLRAKNYLKKKGLLFEEIDLASNKEAYKSLSKLMKRVTVPQIFIGDHHVGGYSDLIKLNEEELTSLLYPEGN